MSQCEDQSVFIYCIYTHCICIGVGELGFGFRKLILVETMGKRESLKKNENKSAANCGVQWAEMR